MASASPIAIEQAFGGTSVPETLGVIEVAQSFTGSATPSYAGATATDPLTFIPGTSHYYNAELQVTNSGGFASLWEDQVGANDFAQAGIDALKPVYLASDSTLNNLPTVSGDGVAKFMTGGPDLVAPGTTPIAKWLIMKVDTWASQARILGGSVIRLGTTAGTSSTRSARLNNGTAGPEITNIVEGTWYLWICCLQNTTGDYLTVGPDSNTVTGTNCGNTNPTAEALFATSAGLSPADVTVYAYGTKASDFTAGEKADLRTWAENITGGAVVT